MSLSESFAPKSPIKGTLPDYLCRRMAAEWRNIMKKAIISILAASMVLSNAAYPVFAEDAAEATGTQVTESAETVTDESSPEASADDTADAAEQAQPAAKENEYNVYVSGSSKGGDGSFESPFKNIEQAINAVRGIDKSKYKVNVNIMGGTYVMDNTLSLEKNDSGSNENPVTYRAYNGEEVKIVGSKSIAGGMAQLVTDQKTLNRIPSTARGKVYKIDMTGAKIDDVENLNFCELIYGDEIMPIAKYPNLGSDYSTKTTGGNTFRLESGKNPSKWINSKDAKLLIILENGYMSVTSTIKSVTNTSVTLSKPDSNLGDGARVKAMNILEELDSPGEWCYVSDTNSVYFYPPDLKVQQELRFATLENEMLKVSEASNINFEGITFSNTKGRAALITNSRNIQFDGCTFKNIGTTAVRVWYCTNFVLKNSTLRSIATTAIKMFGGGNVSNYESSGNTIENCDIYHTGLINSVEGRGIDISSDNYIGDGFGATVRNCRIHDITHEGGISHNVPGLIYENNEVYNCVNDTYDAGAIYAARDDSTRGNIFRNNYIHDITLSKDAKGGATVGLYWDDCTSGQTAYNNIFVNTDLAMLIGGGDENSVTNNIFYKCRSTVSYDNRGENWAQHVYNVSKPSAGHFINISWPNEKWVSKYPYLETLYNYYSNLDAAAIYRPEYNTIAKNALISSGNLSLANSVIKYAKDISNNQTVAENENLIDFKDPDNYDCSFTEDSEVFKKIPGFEKIDFENIGLKEAPKQEKCVLMSPANGETNVQGNGAMFWWKICSGYDKYRLEISRNADFTKMVYDEVITGTRIELDNLKYNKTYYWRVTPVKSSKIENSDMETSEVYSFTAAKNEAVNTTELSGLLNKLGTGWRHAKEGITPGTYKKGSIDALSEAVNAAEEILYNPGSKMFSIRNTTAKLKEAINTFNSNYNYQTVEIDDWIADKNNWTGNPAVHENNLINVNYNRSDASVYSGQEVSANQVLKFKVNCDFTNYDAFAINQGDPSKTFWQTTGYSIIMKRNVFELQKRYYNESGNITAEIITNALNEESIMKSDKWYTIESGILSSPMGPRVIFKIDGKTIIDYVDTSDNLANEAGYFGVQDTSGNAGFTFAGANYETGQED